MLRRSGALHLSPTDGFLSLRSAETGRVWVMSSARPLRSVLRTHLSTATTPTPSNSGSASPNPRPRIAKLALGKASVARFIKPVVPPPPPKVLRPQKVTTPSNDDAIPLPPPQPPSASAKPVVLSKVAQSNDRVTPPPPPPPPLRGKLSHPQTGTTAPSARSSTPQPKAQAKAQVQAPARAQAKAQAQSQTQTSAQQPPRPAAAGSGSGTGKPQPQPPNPKQADAQRPPVPRSRLQARPRLHPLTGEPMHRADDAAAHAADEHLVDSTFYGSLSQSDQKVVEQMEQDINQLLYGQAGAGGQAAAQGAADGGSQKSGFTIRDGSGNAIPYIGPREHLKKLFMKIHPDRLQHPTDTVWAAHSVPFVS